MEIKERTESFDSITSTDSYSFEDDSFFEGGGRDRSSSIAFMMETVKHIERKTRPAWDRGSLTPSRASTDSADSDFCVSEITPASTHPKQRLRSKSKSFAPTLRKSPSTLIIQKERSNKRLKRGNSETFKNSWDFPLIRAKKLNTKREIEEEIPRKNERSNTISLYIEESSDAMTEQEASWMNYLNEGTNDRVQWLPPIPNSTERNVQAATIGWLIKNMVVSLDGRTDKDEFIDVMILTHMIFVSSLELFEKLESYYWTTAPMLTLDREAYLHKSVTKSDLERKFRVFSAFKKWTDYHDLQENEELVARLERFIRILRKSPRPLEITWSRDLKESLNKKPPLSPGIKKKLPKFIRTGFLTIRKVDVKHVNILDIDTMDLVRHLTSSDWKLFKRIKTKELLKKSWSFPDKDTHSPNVVKLIESFNRISHWVATEILTTSNPKMRVKVLEKFVEVLKGLKSVQNFHGIFSIYAALNMNCIQRLTSLWEEISPKHISSMKEIEKLIHPRSNFKTYRNTLKKLQLPYIPFEGLFLQDCTFIEENPDTLENSEMINFEKMAMLRRILHVLKIVQSTPYKFKESGFINDYLKASPKLTEEEMYKISKSIRIAENQHSMDGSVFKKLQHLLH